MKTTPIALALLVTTLAVAGPAVALENDVLTDAGDTDAPSVEVHECRPPYFGWVVVINGRPYTRCMI